MRVFVTGATGFIGSAIVPELIAAGHTVLGLSRNEKAADALAAMSAEAHHGDLEDLESLKRGAEAADGVIHAGFIHDFSRFAEVCEIDRRAIEAMGAALKGTDKPLTVTSGVGILVKDEAITEADMPPATSPYPRVASEHAVDKLAAEGVRVAVVRLPPSVHGEGDHGFVPMLINIVRQQGKAYNSERLNNWCAVHRLDAAKLFRLAAESDFMPGTRFHGVAEERIPFRDIMGLIAKRLGVPLEAKSAEDTAAYFGQFAHFAAMDIAASSKQTQERLGWHPTAPGLLADIDNDYYFSH